MPDRNQEQIDAHTREARGGGAQDSQGDGVADATAHADSLTETERRTKREKEDFSQPGTNREAVPGGLEGSIMEGEGPNNNK